MAECVDREAMLREIERRERLMVRDKTISVDALKRFIENRPTVDAVVVTRCKNCVHLVNATVNANEFLICGVSGMEITPDGFCSYGDPKEEQR